MTHTSTSSSLFSSADAKSVKGVEWQLQPRYFTIRTWTSISLRTPIPADRIRVTRRVLQSPIAASLWAVRICVLSCCSDSQRWTYSLRRSACLHFTHALARSHSNQEDPASLCWAGKRRHQRRLIWILGGGAFAAAFRELPGLNKHPGTCSDAKWSLVSTGCSEVQINYQLPACESGTLWFSSIPQRIPPPISPACSASKLHFGYFVFYSYSDAKPLFFAIFNRCFALEILKQCQATESKQGKKFPNNDQKGNPLCLLACYSTFKMLRMPSR